MTLPENFKFINVYLSYMEPVIHHFQGVIDKYIGYAIMALFPTADKALQSAGCRFRNRDNLKRPNLSGF